MAIVSRVGIGTLYDRDFDQGSYVSIEGTASIRIIPYQHWSSVWAWWAVRSLYLGGQTPTFLIAKANHYNIDAGERLCCWATADDTDTWHDFDNVTIGATDLEFSMNSAFPAGQIFVAALPMHPFSRVQRKVNDWLGNRWASDTTSGTAGVLGTATARSVPDGSGRTCPALPFYGFKITGDRVGDKNKCILSAYNHPSETPGPYQLEGALDWLLGSSAEAEVLRDWFEFYVYPCLNPQGVWSGWFRSSPQSPTNDHNRIWNTTGTDEAIDAFKTAMTADTGGAVDVALDYHSQMENVGRFSNVFDSDGTFEAYYLAEMEALLPGYTLREITYNTTYIYWALNSLSASLAAFPECGGTTTQDKDDWRYHGECTLKAVYEMLIDGRFTYGP